MKNKTKFKEVFGFAPYADVEMTKEGAIERLKTDIYKYADFTENPNENEFWMAFDMAIKALESKTETATEFADRCRECGKRYVKRQTGYWIIRPYGFKCSKCLIVHSHTSIFCPSCGAKMIEPQESEDKE